MIGDSKSFAAWFRLSLSFRTPITLLAIGFHRQLPGSAHRRLPSGLQQLPEASGPLRWGALRVMSGFLPIGIAPRVASDRGPSGACRPRVLRGADSRGSSGHRWDPSIESIRDRSHREEDHGCDLRNGSYGRVDAFWTAQDKVKTKQLNPRARLKKFSNPLERFRQKDFESRNSRRIIDKRKVGPLF
jgi:hypothetical protein